MWLRPLESSDITEDPGLGGDDSRLPTGVDMFSEECSNKQAQTRGLWSLTAHIAPSFTHAGFSFYQDHPAASHPAAPEASLAPATECGPGPWLPRGPGEEVGRPEADGEGQRGAECPSREPAWGLHTAVLPYLLETRCPDSTHKRGPGHFCLHGPLPPLNRVKKLTLQPHRYKNERIYTCVLQHLLQPEHSGAPSR